MRGFQPSRTLRRDRLLSNAVLRQEMTSPTSLPSIDAKKRIRKAVQNSVQLPLRTQDILSLRSQEYSYVLFDAVCMLTPYYVDGYRPTISTGYRPRTSR